MFLGEFWAGLSVINLISYLEPVKASMRRPYNYLVIPFAKPVGLV